MLSGIGSWRWHENGGRFVGSRLHKELECPTYRQPTIEKVCRGRVLRVCKRYAVSGELPGFGAAICSFGTPADGNLLEAPLA